MNREAFFAALRKRDSGVFGTSLSQRQVEGVEDILVAGARLPLPHLAHCLAEAYHETGRTMQPVRETFADTDQSAVARLEHAWTRGQLSWVRTPYWRFDGDGKTWLGRGYVQLTHKANYQKASVLTGVDLVSNPHLAMESEIAARILVEGCASGMFTGKKLGDFNGSPYDHYNARAIVNGDKGKNGRKIAGYARAFERALVAAGYAPRPKPVSVPTLEGQGGGLGAIFRAILDFFTGGKA